MPEKRPKLDPNAQPPGYDPEIHASEREEIRWLVERVAALERRVRELENRQEDSLDANRELRIAREGLESEIKQEAGKNSNSELTPTAAAGTSQAPAPLDLENRLASPALNYLGLIALLIGLTLLIGFSMESHARVGVVVAFLSGGALWGLGRWTGQWAPRGGSEIFSLTLEGASLGLLFLAGYLSYTLWNAAWGMVPSLLAGGAVMLVAMRRAEQRNSQLVAVFALFGALLGTLLLRQVHSGESLLFGYLAAVNVCAVWAGRRQGWLGLRFLALLGSHAVAGFWYSTHPAADPWLTAAFPILTFLLFARIVPSGSPDGAVPAAEIALGVINSAAFLAASASLLRAHDASLLPWSVAALGIVHALLGSVWLLSKTLRPYARLHFWLAAILIAAGLLLVFPQSGVALGWTAEALLLYWMGARLSSPAARNFANLLALGAAVEILFALGSQENNSSLPLRTFSALAYAASVILFHRFAKHYAVQLGNWEWANHWLLAAIATFLPMLVLGRLAAARAAQGLSPALVVSVVWAAYSMGLCLAGWRAASALLRWMGVGLLLVTAVKVFVFDPVTLSGFSRIASFLLLSVFLLLLSYLFRTRNK